MNGTFYEFDGPLYDQSGKLRVQKGKRLTVNELYAMDWLVKGVDRERRRASAAFAPARRPG